MLGRRPPRIIGRVVNTVTRGWVGAPPRSDFMTQSLFLPIDVCRGLGISPLLTKHLADIFSRRSGPNIWPGIMFLYVFFQVYNIFCKDLFS